MLMAMFTQESGKTTKLKEKEPTLTPTELSILVTGWLTSRTDKV